MVIYQAVPKDKLLAGLSTKQAQPGESRTGAKAAESSSKQHHSRKLKDGSNPIYIAELLKPHPDLTCSHLDLWQRNSAARFSPWSPWEEELFLNETSYSWGGLSPPSRVSLHPGTWVGCSIMVYVFILQYFCGLEGSPASSSGSRHWDKFFKI